MIGSGEIDRGIVDIEKTVDDWNANLEASDIDPNIIVDSIFREPEVYSALAKKLSEKELYAWYEATTKFQNVISKENDKRAGGDTSGLFGEETSVPAVNHTDGRVRESESGHLVQLSYLENLGIDPEKVIMFRLTQPSETPKPEYYWTSNYYEAQKGLQAEVLPENRATAVILISDLKTINENKGLIQDRNDSGGLDVRQIGVNTFNQQSAIVLKK